MYEIIRVMCSRVKRTKPRFAHVYELRIIQFRNGKREKIF